jgi:hypothetical protein
MRLQPHFNVSGLAPPRAKPDLLVNKADKMLNAVQNRLNFQLHRCSCAGLFAFSSNSQTNQNAWRTAIAFSCAKHFFTSNSLAAHLGGGRDGQGGAQQGTGARGEQYLDGPDRSHTLAAAELLDPSTHKFCYRH